MSTIGLDGWVKGRSVGLLAREDTGFHPLTSSLNLRDFHDGGVNNAEITSLRGWQRGSIRKGMLDNLRTTRSNFLSNKSGNGWGDISDLLTKLFYFKIISFTSLVISYYLPK